MAEQRIQDTEQSFGNLFEAARSINAYEWAVLQGAESSERESLKQAAESLIAGAQQWPRGGLKAIKDTLARMGSDSPVDLDAREKALRMLCVRAEIQSETLTPTEDEVLRREYQVQRLTQGMGQGISVDDGQWDAMALDWVRVGAIAPDLHQGLRDRFIRGWEKRPMDSASPATLPIDDHGARRNPHDQRAEHTRRQGRDGSKVANRRW